MVMRSFEMGEKWKSSSETAGLIGGEGELGGRKEIEACPVWMLASGWVMGWRVVSGDGGIVRGLGSRRRRRRWSVWGFG